MAKSETNQKSLAEVREEYAASLAEDTKDKEGKIKYNGAKIFIRQIREEFKNDADVYEALGVLAGTGQRGGGGGARRVSPKAAILKTIQEKGEITAMDAFVEFNKGPAEMRDLMKYGIREVAPENRVWIEFDGQSYKVVAEGAETPDGWDGYLPSDSDAMDV